MPVLRQLVEVHHADINTLMTDEEYWGFPLLHVACKLDRTELVEFLISSPIININLACGDSCLTPLHVASMAGSVRAVRQLLALPQIQVNATISQGHSSLLLACLAQKVEVVEDLLRHPDVDVNSIAAEDAWFPLAVAAFKGNSAIVTLLLQHPAINVNAAGMAGGTSPLCSACFQGHAHVVRQLLRHPDIQVNANDGYSLEIACVKEHMQVIQELLLHPGLEAGSIRAVLAATEGRGQTAVVALLKGSRAVMRRALRGQAGA